VKHVISWQQQIKKRWKTNGDFEHFDHTFV